LLSFTSRKPRLPAIVDHTRGLPRHDRLLPPLAGGLVNRNRRLEVLGTRKVSKTSPLASSLSDTEADIGARGHGCSPAFF
jgi:hypothetical protein